MATFFSLSKAHKIASQCGETVHDGNGTYTSTDDGWTYRVVPCRESLHSDVPAFLPPTESKTSDRAVIAVYDETGFYVGPLGDPAFDPTSRA